MLLLHKAIDMWKYILKQIMYGVSWSSRYTLLFQDSTIITLFDGLVQERRNFSALAMEFRPYCTNLSIWYLIYVPVQCTFQPGCVQYAPRIMYTAWIGMVQQLLSLPIPFKIMSLVPVQSYKCPSATETIRNNRGNSHHTDNATTTKITI